MVTHVFKNGSQSQEITVTVPAEIVSRVKEIANREPVNIKKEWRKKWTKK